MIRSQSWADNYLRGILQYRYFFWVKQGELVIPFLDVVWYNNFCIS